MPVVGALRPLLAEVAQEHGEFLLAAAVVTLVSALVIEAMLHVGLGR